MAQNKSFYLADDVLEYLAQHENASAEVTRLVRWKIARDAEAAAYERVNGRPLTDERRSRARDWAREKVADARRHIADNQDAYDDLERRMGGAA